MATIGSYHYIQCFNKKAVLHHVELHKCRDKRKVRISNLGDQTLHGFLKEQAGASVCKCVNPAVGRFKESAVMWT